MAFVKTKRKKESSFTKEIEFDLDEDKAIMLNEIAKMAGVSFDDCVRVILCHYLHQHPVKEK